MVSLTLNQLLPTSAEMQVLLFYVKLGLLLPINCHICAWYGLDIVARMGCFDSVFLCLYYKHQGFKDVML